MQFARQIFSALDIFRSVSPEIIVFKIHIKPLSAFMCGEEELMQWLTASSAE